MKYATRKLRPPGKIHGGKAYMARRIIALMPEHRGYCEPFCGFASVLLNKPPSAHEVAGDVDARLINFWRALQDDSGKFLRLLDMLDYTEETFRWAATPADTAFGDAARFLVRARFSRGGLGRDFAWSDRTRGKRRVGGPVPGDVNAWDTIRAELPAIAERVRDVEFRLRPGLGLIREHDGPGVLTYADPPYLHATRTHTGAYASEMTDRDHAELLDTLGSCRGLVMLSGYPSDLYDAALAGWNRVDFPMPNHSGQGRTKGRRVEVVWTNF